MDRIPDRAWNAHVTTRQHAAERTFSDEIGDQATLLIFLRHLG